MTEDPRDRMTPEQKAAMAVGHQIGQNFITDEDFTARYLKSIEIAKLTFERDGYHSHMMIAYLHHNKTGEPVVIPAMFADWPPPDGKKEETLMGIGIKFAEDAPDCTLETITHISEGYMTSQESLAASGKDNINDMDDADRIEVLTISLTSQDLRQSYCSLQIIRKPDETFSRWGDKPELEELYNPDSDIHPLATGDFLPHAVIKGYMLARSQERGL